MFVIPYAVVLAMGDLTVKEGDPKSKWKIGNMESKRLHTPYHS
jgi:hypothetical protein